MPVWIDEYLCVLHIMRLGKDHDQNLSHSSLASNKHVDCFGLPITQVLSSLSNRLAIPEHLCSSTKLGL